MSKKETQAQIKSMRSFQREVKASKEKALAALRAAGIVDDKGALTEHYRPRAVG